MAGTPEVPPSRDARLLEVEDDAYSGLLARVRGSPDLRVIRASRASQAGSKDKGHLKGVSAVYGSSDASGHGRRTRRVALSRRSPIGGEG
eukprot:5541319-Pleurochrysis_carterae.AAC.1